MATFVNDKLLLALALVRLLQRADAPASDVDRANDGLPVVQCSTGAQTGDKSLTSGAPGEVN